MKKKMREKYPHYYDPKKMKEYLKKFKKWAIPAHRVPFK
jgi:hypothetical protein